MVANRFLRDDFAQVSEELRCEFWTGQASDLAVTELDHDPASVLFRRYVHREERAVDLANRSLHSSGSSASNDVSPPQYSGGPRGNRPCAFHESVDTYQRQCLATVNADGSVLVSANGTKLNPDHGFEFTLHGGADNVWVAQGRSTLLGNADDPSWRGPRCPWTVA